MGIAQSSDGAARAADVKLLRHLDRKGSVNIALQQQGEIEAGSTVHGYVEVFVKDPKVVERENDVKDRYKYNYADLQRRNEVHFSTIRIELIGEIITCVRFADTHDHGQRSKTISMKKRSEAANDSDDESSPQEPKRISGLMVGHVMDQHGGILNTNLSTHNQAHQTTVLYREQRIIANAATTRADHLFGNINDLSMGGPSDTNKHSDEVLSAGKHRFPFAFKIPEDAQSTCAMLRSYSGDNSAASTCRLIVSVESPDDSPLSMGDKIATGLSSNLHRLTRVQVHSVPLIIRAKLPMDPALRSSTVVGAMPGDTAGYDSHALKVSEYTRNSESYVSFDASGNVIRDIRQAIIAPLHSSQGRDSAGGSSIGSSFQEVSSSDLGMESIKNSVISGWIRGSQVERTASNSGFLLQPLVVDTQSMISCCCLPWGRTISLQARSDKFSYCTDEMPRIEWEITAKSRRKVRNITVELIRRCEWSAHEHKYESELILSQANRVVDGTGSKATELEFGVNANQTVSIRIPRSDPSSILVCSSISTTTFSVSYFIRIVAHVFPGKGSCCVRNPLVCIPIHVYTRFHTEMGVSPDKVLAGVPDAKAHVARLPSSLGPSDRFPISTNNLPLLAGAVPQYLRLFSMYGGLSYVSHEDGNLIAPLCAPIVYEENANI